MSTPTTENAPRPERVTHALVRDVTLPRGAGTLALVTLDNGFDHTKPTTLGPGGLTELQAALRTQQARAAAGRTPSYSGWCGFSQITVPPWPRPTHIVVRP